MFSGAYEELQCSAERSQESSDVYCIWIAGPNGLLKHIASAFQSLHLIFKAFNYHYIIVCAFKEQHVPLVKISKVLNRSSSEHTWLCLLI